MHRYFIKTPWWLSRLYRGYEWKIPSDDTVYLSFDDGPHPEITPWVMERLRSHGARATFFCIGDNVRKYESVYRQLLQEGHAVGNHTFHHLNGWKTKTEDYLEDIRQAAALIDTDLFRPPYGRITGMQGRGVAGAMQKKAARVIMWDVLSGDFDRSFSAERCTDHVLRYAVPGSIIVFHDSEKAFPNLKETLPSVLKEFSARGWKMKAIAGT